MKHVYPAVFRPENEGGFCVFFPDIERGATQGETIPECIDMAQDFLCLALYDMYAGQSYAVELDRIL